MTEDFIVKIADFGFLRLTEDEKNYDRKKLKQPSKRSSNEALNAEPTPSSSHLWTFGLLSWELFTLYTEPYGKMEPDDYKAFMKNGQRLEKPPYAPTEM